MRFRGTTIRRKIVALLLIPLVSLAAIWAFAATLTGRAVFGRPNIERLVTDVDLPSEAVVGAVQQERKVALIYVADTSDSQARASFHQQEQATDAVVSKLYTELDTSHVRRDLDGKSEARLDTFLSAVDGLGTLRSRVDGRRITREETYEAYNSLVNPAFDLFFGLNPINDVQLDSQRRAVVSLERAREEVSRQDALMSAAITSGDMSQPELTAFTFSVAEERNYYDDNLKLLSSADRSPYEAFWAGTDGKTLRSTQDNVIENDVANAPLVAAHLSWSSVAGAAYDDLNELNEQSMRDFNNKARPVPTYLVVEAAIAGGFGLVAVVASVLVSVLIGRGLVRDLTELRREAQEVSGTRLPRVMRRLAAGEQVDIETEVPRLTYADDEIGQVGRALNTLQRAAVEAAVRQADMRKGVSEVFVNLARRSQVLLHRQLTLLDAMERRTDKSDELADLFRLDHMTTRMRRHAEGLVILSGASPSRQWRKPVQLMDVVRAAIAEVEDYERIDVRRLPRLAVVGAAVADLTHLLAELIENAAVFSPPHTPVRLHGEQVASGFVLEIDDRGLGLPPDAMLEANLRLAETPEFELSDTDRLGLFVVSRLAQRHGVRVSLRESPYGGTTAVVLIPANLLTDTGDDTGSTRLEPEPAPVELVRPDEDAEHTFRQWGLDPAAAEPTREHREHREQAAPAGVAARAASTDALDEPAPLPDPEPGPDGSMPLPRRRRTAPVLISDHGRTVGGQQEDGARPQPSVRAVPEHGARTGTPPVQAVRPPAAAQPPAPLPPAAPVPPTAADTGLGLPRRVRQANLAPQLRSDARSGERPAGAARGRERSAEEVRDRMAALQRGWQRGRESEDPEPGPGAGPDAHPDETPTAAPRMTPEGDVR